MKVGPEVGLGGNAGADTFTIPMVRQPRRRASRSAARVSAVSPDWLIPSTRVSGVRTAFRYLNSDAYSTVTGIRASSSSM